MNTDDTATAPRIRPHPRVDGVRVLDPIEDAQFSLLTPDPVAPTDCGTDGFYFPVDTAVTIETDRIETPYAIEVWIRDDAGELVAEASTGEAASVPAGRYNVELSTTEVKLYLAVESAIEVTASDDAVRLSLPETTTVRIGARSFHEQPAGTVTTTDDPEDVMAAVSTLGSALKTTSCERSFPTLRGHPPLVERGAELDVPDGLEPPATDVRIEVPPELRYVYPVASLAYYLGVTVEPGPEPRLVVDGRTHSLTGPEGFEARVGTVLQHVFLLDCVTRTEGYYQVDLHERTLVEDDVDLDFAALYDRSLAERVNAYLDVPFAAVDHAVPKWKLTADVVPDPAHVSTLPFLANDLALVRCPGQGAIRNRSVDDLSERVAAFFRDRPNALARGSSTSNTRSEASPATVDEPVFQPPAADSIEQAYVGDGIPFGASKMTVESYYRRLDHEPSPEPYIRVAVVCNDQEMVEENVVSGLYGARDWLDFDISLDSSLTVAEMRELLRSDIDFLHYIGHVDDAGIRCADGVLDAATMDDVGVDSFLLNACNSYDQGKALVDGGALAGIATVTDVLNENATSIGRTVARLLNGGFPLAATIPIVKEHEHGGQHYVVIGDGSASLVTSRSGTPYRVTIDSKPDGYSLSLYGYPCPSARLGTMFRPFVKDDNRRFLNSGRISEYDVSKSEVAEFLGKQTVPVDYGSELYWSDTLQSSFES